MCGIVGFIINNDTLPLDIVIGQMISSLRHRGPDDYGCWIDRNAGVVLGHTRLSVLDLSPQGHQPMHSACGRYVIVFNGEIYNFQQIRRELEEISGKAPIQWRGSSDTEVMLAAFSSWGVEASLKRFVGMFAFGLWDRQERILYLARDRVGEKPLYYGWSGGAFLFGSELKAVRAHPNFRAEINRDAISLLLRYNYIPAPFSIYQGINKLLPGSFLKIPLAALVEKCSLTPVPYWSVREVAENGITNPFTESADEAAKILNNLLVNAVRGQMVADVPLGAFLSGGVDSSTIVALMQAQSSRPVRSFTIGFHEKDYNEALHAKAVAQHIGTDHTELYINPSDALSVIPKLPSLYDEPFSDSSQIPTFLISQLTRRHVTVSLSGDAGDELFGGYNRYFWAAEIWRKIGWMPKEARAMLSRLLQSFSPTAWDSLFHRFRRVIPQRYREKRVGEQLHKLAEINEGHCPFEMYPGLVSHWKEPTHVVLRSSEPLTALTDMTRRLPTNDHILQMMYIDMITYLPDDILVKVDRAAMAVSLETRVPFLDHRIVEFAWRLPLSMKIRNGQGKWILRQVLYKYVPRELIERPKSGFAIPIGSWLRADLRDWAESLLDESRLKNEGYFDPKPIRQKWEEHLSGAHNWQYYLWDILMFQAWLEENQCIV